MHTETLHFSTDGKGNAVVFLHGFLEQSSMWKFMNAAEINSHCIFIDLPGHGKSNFRINQYPGNGMKLMAQMVRNTLQKLKIEQYSVVGHSMGGYVALEIKEMDPNCDKVLLLHSHFWEDDEERKKNRIRFSKLAIHHSKRLAREVIPALFFNPSAFPKQMDEMVEHATTISGDAMAFATLSMMNRKNHKNLMQQFPHQISMIHGVHDPLMHRNTIIHHCQSLQNKIEWLENAGHMGHFEEPDSVRYLLKNWLNT
jgi:pimeloyl-ACP methyl ester carboxylesterase